MAQKNRHRVCPSCERPVAGCSGVCPYCGEPLPGTGRAWLAWHVPMAAFALAAVPCAVWPSRAIAALPFAALLVAEWVRAGCRPVNRWLAAAVFLLGAACVADPALRYDAALLWSRHGRAIGFVLVAVWALWRDPEAGGVASDQARARLASRGAHALVDVALAVAVFMLLH